MSVWDLRQLIESNMPAWLWFVVLAVLVVIWCIERFGK